MIPASGIPRFRGLQEPAAPSQDAAKSDTENGGLSELQRLSEVCEELRCDILLIKRELARVSQAVDADGAGDSGPDGGPAAPRTLASIRNHPGRVILAAVLLAALAAVAPRTWHYWTSYETTDDAQVDGHIVPLGSRIPGTIVSVHVEDNQRIKAGTLLAEIDPRDYRVALDRARAELAQARDSLQSIEQAEASAEAQLRAAVAMGARARKDADRFEVLMKSRVIAGADYDHTVSAAQIAGAGAEAARSTWLALTKSLLSQRDAVKSMQAAVDAAELNLSYTRIVAPIDAIVGRRAVEPGQLVQPGQQLLALVDVDHLWITANFMETQVGRMHPGLPVSVRVDMSGRDYAGFIQSLAGATGEKYVLLPPENATGNYVKVVQRIPVRLGLNPGQPEEDELRPGMSVEATVWLR